MVLTALSFVLCAEMVEGFVKMKFALYHFRCGLHSGFRVCDILFFALWRTILTEGARDWYFERFMVPGNYGYVPCLLCLALKRVPVAVKKCGCNYNKEFYE